VRVFFAPSARCAHAVASSGEERLPTSPSSWSRKLGWTAHTPLKEGLVRTIAYFEALLQEDGVRAVVGGEK
jgi:hypothetical protein